jgi:hypothetical protein
LDPSFQRTPKLLRLLARSLRDFVPAKLGSKRCEFLEFVYFAPDRFAVKFANFAHWAIVPL